MHGWVVALLLWSGPEPGASAKAEQYANEAQAEYEDGDGDLSKAVELIQQAYALDPKAEYLYMWAQAERSAGKCNRALPLYREFLSRGEEFSPQDRPAWMAPATEAIETCEREVDPEDEITPALLTARRIEPEEEPPDTLEPVEPRQEPKPAADTEPKPTRRRVDPLGVSLVAVGGAAMIAGGVLGSIALYDRNTATEADDEVRYAEQVRREPTLRWTGIGLLAGGALVVGGGIARLLIVRRRPSSTALRVEPTLGGATLHGRF